MVTSRAVTHHPLPPALGCLAVLALGCGARPAPLAQPSGAAEATLAVPLQITHLAASGASLLLAGVDGDGRGCVYALDPGAGTTRPVRCVAGERVRGLAGADGAALAVVGPEGDAVAGGRLLAVPLAPGGDGPRVLGEGALGGPMVVHDGLVDAAEIDGVLRAPLAAGAPPSRLAERFYNESARVFWHRGRHYGLRAGLLVARDDGSVRRPVAGLRWLDAADDGERLWGVDRRGDGVIELERWTSADARPVGVAALPGGEAYAIAATRRAVVVASGRTLTEVRSDDGRVSPGGVIPGEGAVLLQGVGDAVYAVWQEVSCAGGGRMAGAPHRAETCAPVARARRASSRR